MEDKNVKKSATKEKEPEKKGKKVVASPDKDKHSKVSKKTGDKDEKKKKKKKLPTDKTKKRTKKPTKKEVDPTKKKKQKKKKKAIRRDQTALAYSIKIGAEDLRKAALAKPLEDDLIKETEIHKDVLLKTSAYGKVYKGTCRGETVAIKELIQKFKSEKEEKEEIAQLEQEVRIMKALRHPKLVMLMGICVTQQTRSIIMEFVDGGDLSDIIKRRDGALSLVDHFRLSRDIAIALNWLHKLDPPIIHRDIKPANIMLTKDLNVKVCDFGFSCIKPKEQATEVRGTPMFVAPELFDGTPASEKSDVYAYGILLLGFWARIEDVYPNLQTLNALMDFVCEGGRPEIPARTMPHHIENLIQRCWEQDPQDRPDFEDIILNLNEAMVRVVLPDPMARDYWREFTGPEFMDSYPFFVKWPAFRSQLLNFLELPKNDVHCQAVECIRILFAEQLRDLTKSVHSREDIIKIEKFAKFIKLFGGWNARTFVEFTNLCKAGYFHGDIGSEEAAKRLRGAAEGTFLVRITSAGDGLVVSLVKANGILHIKIDKTDGGFFFDTNRNAITPSLIELIAQNKDKLKFLNPLCEGSPFAELFDMTTEVPDAGIYMTAGQAKNF